jgi:hypothetical protein
VSVICTGVIVRLATCRTDFRNLMTRQFRMRASPLAVRNMGATDVCDHVNTSNCDTKQDETGRSSRVKRIRFLFGRYLSWNSAMTSALVYSVSRWRYQWKDNCFVPYWSPTPHVVETGFGAHSALPTYPLYRGGKAVGAGSGLHSNQCRS